MVARGRRTRPRSQGHAPAAAVGGSGYTLTELLVVVVIMIVVVVAVLPNLKQRLEQGRVDGVTTRLEGALNSLRRQSLTYQTSCSFSWSLASSNQTLTAGADQIGSRLVLDPTTCVLPTGSPSPRLAPPLRSPDDNDVLVTISPDRFTITALGGLTTAANQPLLLRLRANRPFRSGDFERCLRLEPISGALSRGTWLAGDCRRNR
ncbi:MAG: hypothetical protein ACKOCM_07700 [Cyanobacteriota bacterium]